MEVVTDRRESNPATARGESNPARMVVTKKKKKNRRGKNIRKADIVQTSDAGVTTEIQSSVVRVMPKGVMTTPDCMLGNAAEANSGGAGMETGRQVGEKLATETKASSETQEMKASPEKQTTKARSVEQVQPGGEHTSMPEGVTRADKVKPGVLEGLVLPVFEMEVKDYGHVDDADATKMDDTDDMERGITIVNGVGEVFVVKFKDPVEDYDNGKGRSFREDMELENQQMAAAGMPSGGY